MVAFVEKWSIKGLRSLEREDAVHLGRVSDWCPFGGFGPENSARGQPLPIGDIWERGSPYFGGCHLAPAWPLGG